MAQYWYAGLLRLYRFLITKRIPRFFVQLYPSAIDLETNMVRELRDIVLHLIGGREYSSSVIHFADIEFDVDSMTSPYSTACFPLDGLYKILSLTGELERASFPYMVVAYKTKHPLGNTGSGSHGSMCLLGTGVGCVYY